MRISCLVASLLCLAEASTANATQIILEDGRILIGRLGKVTGLAEVPKGIQVDESAAPPMIVFLNDDLRRTYVPQRQVVNVGQEPAEPLEKFFFRQRALRGGRMVKSIGPILRVTPFDEYGRRIFTMNTAQGPLDIIQGITELTPRWAKVEGVTHVWDMRLATSSIPQSVMDKMVSRQVDEANLEDRKKVARFYLQCDRYEAAAREIDALLIAHPELKKDLESSLNAIRKMGADRLLAELNFRRKAGQDGMVQARLKEFPTDGVPGETLQAVREMIQQYAAQETARADVLKQLDAVVQQIPDPVLRKALGPIQKEIVAELSITTLERMAAFRQMVAAPNIPVEEKAALAVSGWLLGQKGAITQLSMATSLVNVRSLVREYLAAPNKLSRMKVFESLPSEQGARPDLVAALIAHMKPPLDAPSPSEDAPGAFSLEVPGLATAPAVRYLVQLPPEYDPYRRYPAVVTLHGAGSTAAQQIDWWAGAVTKGGWRAGQSSRQGYIVIAPEWSAEHQKQYGYSAREQAAVLDSFRDASQRFSIDTDRVFLSGHSMGGDAAWDIGLAHPDLWAGVIPIVAQADRYAEHYWKNAATVPLYFVNGELDGGKMTENAKEWDRYLTSSKKREFNVTVAEFLGRGHENFSDEILRLFDWMNRFRREPFPKRFTAVTMRLTDNFFWWLELKQMPPRAMVDPSQWPPSRGTRALETTAAAGLNNTIIITTGAGQVTVWLSPEMVDLDRRINVKVNGGVVNTGIQGVAPNLNTLLEDVRVRGDRQHPFWAKVESSTGRLPPTGKF